MRTQHPTSLSPQLSERPAALRCAASLCLTKADDFSKLTKVSPDGTNPGYEQAGPGAHGFQEICTSSVAVALEWGLFGYAEGVLENYLRYFVRPGGRVLYRGEPQHRSQIVRAQAVLRATRLLNQNVQRVCCCGGL